MEGKIKKIVLIILLLFIVVILVTKDNQVKQLKQDLIECELNN